MRGTVPKREIRGEGEGEREREREREREQDTHVNVDAIKLPLLHHLCDARRPCGDGLFLDKVIDMPTGAQSKRTVGVMDLKRWICAASEWVSQLGLRVWRCQKVRFLSHVRLSKNAPPSYHVLARSTW